MIWPRIKKVVPSWNIFTFTFNGGLPLCRSLRQREVNENSQIDQSHRDWRKQTSGQPSEWSCTPLTILWKSDDEFQDLINASTFFYCSKFLFFGSEFIHVPWWMRLEDLCTHFDRTLFIQQDSIIIIIIIRLRSRRPQDFSNHCDLWPKKKHCLAASHQNLPGGAEVYGIIYILLCYFSRLSSFCGWLIRGNVIMSCFNCDMSQKRCTLTHRFVDRNQARPMRQVIAMIWGQLSFCNTEVNEAFAIHIIVDNLLTQKSEHT